MGRDAALDAARLVTAWATGFVNMELSGSFRFDGDLDRAFEYGLERLLRASAQAGVVTAARNNAVASRRSDTLKCHACGSIAVRA